MLSSLQLVCHLPNVVYSRPTQSQGARGPNSCLERYLCTPDARRNRGARAGTSQEPHGNGFLLQAEAGDRANAAGAYAEVPPGSAAQITGPVPSIFAHHGNADRMRPKARTSVRSAAHLLVARLEHCPDQPEAVAGNLSWFTACMDESERPTASSLRACPMPRFPGLVLIALARIICVRRSRSARAQSLTALSKVPADGLCITDRRFGPAPRYL